MGSRRRKLSSDRPSIVWSDRALRDLEAIDEYVAQDNPAAAARWIDKIIKTVEEAASAPLAGRVVPEMPQPDLREYLLKSYRIVYRVSDEQIEVVTVFEGHHRLPTGLD